DLLVGRRLFPQPTQVEPLRIKPRREKIEDGQTYPCSIQRFENRTYCLERRLMIEGNNGKSIVLEGSDVFLIGDPKLLAQLHASVAGLRTAIQDLVTPAVETGA